MLLYSGSSSTTSHLLVETEITKLLDEKGPKWLDEASGLIASQTGAFLRGVSPNVCTGFLKLL